MTETLESVSNETGNTQELARRLLEQAQAEGVELTGPNGLLNQLTRDVLETALDAEMTEHLGYGKHDPAGRDSGNSRNGTRAKTVFTEIGPVAIEVPRDTASTFEPQIVKKRQRRLTGIDEIVLSLTAKGLTTGEIAAHFADVHGATVSKDTISRITDKVLGEMADWCSLPLERIYPVVFIDAIHVKIRDGQVGNQSIYVAIGVTVTGHRDIRRRSRRGTCRSPSRSRRSRGRRRSGAPDSCCPQGTYRLLAGAGSRDLACHQAPRQ
ncbi:transposase-like protein [Haloactinomyces albus]|uniref:Mutator family transposase n=1 Tax=Haloactinomyces albus TaxID=1352928 RepID=A0AAE4CNJ4_9ACTN|nr:transposase-like protein [Haloactinomyces albus]